MEIMNFIDTLSKNSLVVLVSNILAIIGIFLSIVFYYKGREKKSISYNVVDTPLIGNFEQKINGLTIQYSGKDIERLSETNFLFWNSGTETIRQNDIPHNDRFSITIKDANYILGTSIIKAPNKANSIDIKLSDDRKKIDIDFEYIDKGNCFKIQIFHTGEKYIDFDVNGSIMGFGKISKGFTKKGRHSLGLTIYSLIGIAPICFFLVNYAVSNFKHSIFLTVVSVFLSLNFFLLAATASYRNVWPSQ